MKVNNIDWILEPQKEKQKGGLAISNVRYFDDAQNLQADKIGAVISVFGEKDLTVPEGIKHLRILISDHPKQKINTFFQSSYTFIDSHIKKTNVVVHCQAGVSRSASLVIAYIMRKQRLPFDVVLQKVREKRSIVNPNKGFTKQLKQFESEIQKMPEQVPDNNSCKIF